MTALKLLALDTSSKAASCALMEDGVLLGEYFLNAGLTHSQTLMPMVEALLAANNTAVSDIDRFAVNVGPGSFTGLRIGVSVVKGMAMERGAPCAPISTLLSLAYNVYVSEGIILPVLDARRSQVYTALFRCYNGGINRIEPDEALSLDQLGERLARYARDDILVCGDGAQFVMEQLGGEIRNLRLCPETLRLQRAGSVALAALLARGYTVPPEDLEPVYLRLPQAERERLEKKEKQA